MFLPEINVPIEMLVAQKPGVRAEAVSGNCAKADVFLEGPASTEPEAPTIVVSIDHPKSLLSRVPRYKEMK